MLRFFLFILIYNRVSFCSSLSLWRMRWDWNNSGMQRHFRGNYSPTLGQNEILHNLILGIASRLVEMPDVHTEPAYMALVEREGAIRLAGLMTPPRDLLFAAVGEPDEEDVRLIVKSLVDGGWQVPGVSGANAGAAMFARVWGELTGIAYEEKMSLRLFDLREVIPPRPAKGVLRLAEADDLDLAGGVDERF